MDRLRPPCRRPRSRPSRRSARQHVPTRQRQSFWRSFGIVPPPFPGLVTPTVAFRDTPAGSPLTRHRVHSAGLATCRVPRAPLDALENLPNEAPRQVAFGELQGEVSRMPDQPPARLEQALLQAVSAPLDQDFHRPIALRFQSSHERTTPGLSAPARALIFSASSGARYTSGPASVSAWSCRRAFSSV